MTLVRHRYPAYLNRKDRASKTTVWLLVAVVVALVLALTFGDAEGLGLFR